MTTEGERIAERWRDASHVRRWLAEDDLGDLLSLPRALAAAIVALELPAPGTVVDVASGPGTFLGVFLEEFPGARGIWLDASEAMLEAARARLERFGDRVTYRLGDMTDLEGSGVPDRVEVLLTSRALHHLDPAGLAAFYRAAAAHLAPGGWLANLDHVGVAPQWERRFQAVRHRFGGRRTDSGTSSHQHRAELPRVEDHLGALAAAGIEDAEVAWRGLRACLIMGRKRLGGC